MCTNKGGGRGSSGGGGITAQSVANQLTTPIKIIDRGGLPELSGSANEVEKAKRIRNQTGKYLQNYVATNGGTASPEITSKYINGSAEEKAAFVMKRAEDMTFGNKKLLPDKIKSEIAAQKEQADRYSRFTEVITHQKSAKWWTGQGSTAVATTAMENYIDGKGWNTAILGKK